MLLLLLAACLGGGRHEVALEDLAPLGADTLASLQDEEHAVIVARTMIDGAKQEAERVDARLDQGREQLAAAELEYDATLAELSAAKAMGDAWRRGNAEGAVAAARQRRDAARARVDWLEAADDAAEYATTLADARLVLARAQLELARVDVLERAGRGSDYIRADFVDAVRDAQKETDDAERAFDRATEEAGRRYDAWQRELRTVPPVG